uniref:Putative methyltransferase n=1 Tax=Phakopsora virus B TaxID=2592798 RepID=A0A7G3W8S0_9VIRU|nr:putative methyltransferase [Phakopsora virus B]
MLMAENSRYMKTVHQYAIRSCRLHGRRLLVLGSGSSSAMLPLVSRGPSLVVFVDSDPLALERLGSTIARNGLEASSVIEYRVEDANDYLAHGGDGAKFDVVLCTKALGQILRSGSATYDFMDKLHSMLNPGADVLIDQHDAYQHGSTIGACASAEEYDLATIGGRFSSDVCYTLRTYFDGYECVGTFRSCARTAGPQVWTLFHFRVPVAEHSLEAHVLATPPPRVTPIRHSEPQFDSVGDVAVPINAKGAKTILSDQDKGRHSLGLMYPKINGIPGVLHVTPEGLLFISSVYRFFHEAEIAVDNEYEVVAEMVPRGDECVFFVTSLLSISGVDADPLDVAPLAGLEKILLPAAQHGVLVNSPSFIRHITGDSFPVLTPSGPMTIPVDGVHISDGKQNGLFFKPAPHCTIDATCAQVKGIISSAASLVDHGCGDVEESKGSGVWEFSRNGGGWYPVRPRPDKEKSDRPGQVIHTMIAEAASRRAQVMTVQGMVAYLRD